MTPNDPRKTPSHGSRERRRLVCAVDLARPVQDLDVEGFDGAVVVAMIDGRPIGRVTLPTSGREQGGILAGSTLETRLRSALWYEIWTDELRRRIRGTLASSEEPPRHLSTTVAVCTRDRPDHLERCLTALSRLDPAPDRVLVVDNAPRLPCREIVERHGFDYAVEPLPGLDNARNRAVALCTTELIAFTDDDCIPIPAWLACLDHRFADLATGAVTGWGSAARLDSEAQITFEELGGFNRGFNVRRFDWNVIAPGDAGVTGAGANMIFRVDTLRSLGGFPPELDAGTLTASGGDTYVLARMIAAGWRIVFDPSCMVWHDHRADVPELRRVMRGYGRGIGAMVSRTMVMDREFPAFSTYRWPFRALRQAVSGVVHQRGSLLELLAAAEQARGTIEAPVMWSRALRRAPANTVGVVARAGGAQRPAARPNRSMAPEISVVVPTIAARGRILERCLAALGTQTLDRSRYEVVVVPNGPGAASFRSTPGADVVVPISAPGAAGARNAGASAAKAPHLVFFDDDILAAPECLQTHLERARRGERVVLAPSYPATPFRTLAEQSSGRWWLDHYSRKHRPGHRFTFVDLLTGNLGISRDLFLSFGGFDAAFGAHRGEDWEFGCRLLRAGIPFAVAPDAVAYHHHASTARRLYGDTLREGYGHVLLVARHPEVLRDLRLANLATPRAVKGRRWRVNAAYGRAVNGPLAGAVNLRLAWWERSHRRQKWSTALARLMTASYIAGVQAAFDDGHTLPSRPTITRTTIDLDAEVPPNVAIALGEINVRFCGQDLGHVIAPDGHWDEEEIVNRIVDELGMPALAAQAKRGRG